MKKQHSDEEMRVKKRNGSFENIAFDKILNRVKNLGKSANICFCISRSFKTEALHLEAK